MKKDPLVAPSLHGVNLFEIPDIQGSQKGFSNAECAFLQSGQGRAWNRFLLEHRHEPRQLCLQGHALFVKVGREVLRGYPRGSRLKSLEDLKERIGSPCSPTKQGLCILGEARLIDDGRMNVPHQFFQPPIGETGAKEVAGDVFKAVCLIENDRLRAGE